MLQGRRKRSDYGEKWAVAVALMDKPCSFDEIEEHFVAIARRFGFFNIGNRIKKYSEKTLKNYLEDVLANMQDLGWVKKNAELYSLTDIGTAEAQKAYKETRKFSGILKKKINSNSVSFITFVVHLFLVIVKLPAAILSGSVGLLNDALDTLADLLSSLFVWIGIRKQKERLANKVLIFLMLVTGGLTFCKAVAHAFNPVMPEADVYSFTATIISAILCSVLYLYQRYTGIKTKTPALITQSADSRNHIFAAVSVFAGLIAVKLNFVWLDIAVGLAVAIFICKTAVELLIDSIKRAKGDEEDYRIGKFSLYANYKSREYRLWMLNTIKNNDFCTEEELRKYVSNKLDTTGNRSLMAFDKDIFLELDRTVSECITILKSEKYIAVNEKLEVTEKGQKEINDRTKEKVGNTMKYIKTILKMFWYAVEFTLLLIGLRYISSLINTVILWQNDLHTIYLFGNVYYAGNIIATFGGLILYVYGKYHFSEVSKIHRHIGENELIVTGYYKKVRHPMYSMMAIMQIGVLSAVCYRWAAVFSVIWFIVMYGNAFFEEKSLINSLGDKYTQYKQTTKNRLFSTLQMVYIVMVLLNNIAGVLGVY